MQRDKDLSLNFQEPAGHQQQKICRRRHQRRAGLPAEEIPVPRQQKRNQVPGQDPEQVTSVQDGAWTAETSGAA